MYCVNFLRCPVDPLVHALRACHSHNFTMFIQFIECDLGLIYGVDIIYGSLLVKGGLVNIDSQSEILTLAVFRHKFTVAIELHVQFAT